MRLFVLSFISCILLFTTCKKNDEKPSIDYPEGVQVIDLDTENDCTLEDCSEQRVERLQVEDGVGIVNEFEGIFSIVSSVSFDSAIRFITCDIDTVFKDKKVEFSGTARDACGFFTPIHPFEGVYFIHLIKIDSI